MIRGRRMVRPRSYYCDVLDVTVTAHVFHAVRHLVSVHDYSLASIAKTGIAAWERRKT